ncbi:hypothetical protein [Candidatus Methylobacter oryzae]|uniref:Endonuclease n=1 Tax=Candidatus Methylobacter oryzae TaxID=2497749 RepID=A0ABY3CGF7_9GAMM|nr:hypothetical protein [Candidatus Methylobacter oryzae]TRX02913.1 hypothetical protein EKO24_001110 [Candidatus Methylobacter oryzae]
MKKLIAVIALASGMGAAYADQPVALTDAQMDNVSAGALVQVSEAAGTGNAFAVLGHTNVYASANTGSSTSFWGNRTYASTHVNSSAQGFLVDSTATVQAGSAILKTY